MAAMSKFWTIPLVIAVFVIGPFLIWGETLGALMTPDPDTGAYPGGRKWLWATAIGLLIADIFIPIPTTVPDSSWPGTIGYSVMPHSLLIMLRSE